MEDYNGEHPTMPDIGTFITKGFVTSTGSVISHAYSEILINEIGIDRELVEAAILEEARDSIVENN